MTKNQNEKKPSTKQTEPLIQQTEPLVQQNKPLARQTEALARQTVDQPLSKTHQPLLTQKPPLKQTKVKPSLRNSSANKARRDETFITPVYRLSVSFLVKCRTLSF